MSLFNRLFDDAALFPPGSASLPDALSAHHAHRRSSSAGLLGDFVVPSARIGDLQTLLEDDPLQVSLILPGEPTAAPAAISALQETPQIRLRALETALPGECPVTAFFASLDAVAVPADTTVYVEIPRDDRGSEVIAALAGTPRLAKLRTGGITAGAYSDETELATSIVSLAHAGVAFKATAGLHRAVRNTDPATGFEQHGFLNLILATDAAINGATPGAVASILADRRRAEVAARVADVAPTVRSAFVGIGTCSLSEPVDELTALGLIPSDPDRRMGGDA